MLRTLQPTGAAWAVALSPDGRLVAAGAGSGNVEVWNVASGERVATFEGHRKRVAGLAFSPDGRMLASASWDGSARVWTLSSNGPNQIVEVGNNLTAVAFGPGGRQIAIGARDKSIRIWDLASRTETQKLRNQDREPQALAFSPDGEMLASGAAESVVRVWRLNGDGKPQKLYGPGTGTSALAFSPDGRRLAGEGADRVRVWDVAEGQEIRTEDAPGWLHALAPSPGGRFLSLGAVANSLELKTVGDSSAPGPLPGEIKARSVALSADGKRAAAAAGDGTVAVWDTGR
jgi:WD40 repeat protein